MQRAAFHFRVTREDLRASVLLEMKSLSRGLMGLNVQYVYSEYNI